MPPNADAHQDNGVDECRHPARRAFRGSIIHSLDLDDLEIIADGLIIIDADGVILQLLDLSSEESTLALERDFSEIEIADHSGQLIIPGMIDAHCHAPQHLFAGTGMDLPLLDWLERYTFPTEAKFSDESMAAEVYEKVVARHLKSGTTFASYFATIHTNASIALAQACNKAGQRAYIGKVTMDRNSPDFYIEEADEAVKEAESFAVKVLNMNARGAKHSADCEAFWRGESSEPPPPLLNQRHTPTVLPCITPRFVPSCTGATMEGLGNIAKKFTLPVQSHLSENPDEIAWVSELHPDCETYAHVYEKYNLLGPSSFMAHCCHSPETELTLLAKSQTGVVHCPSSNLMLCSGIADIKKMLSMGINVGIGTDVAGGFSPSMFDAMRLTLQSSRAHALAKYQSPLATPQTRVSIADTLSVREVFYLATVGNAQVLGNGKMLGNFLPGKKLDALVVNVDTGASFDVFGHEGLEELFSKFIFQGDDRCISSVIVNGEYVLGREKAVAVTSEESFASHAAIETVHVLEEMEKTFNKRVQDSSNFIKTAHPASESVTSSTVSSSTTQTSTRAGTGMRGSTSFANLPEDEQVS